MDDMISRQEAISRAVTITMFGRDIRVVRVSELENLPPAQPGVINCKDCKYGVHAGRGDVYLCVVSPEERSEHIWDFWCAYAERRTNGSNR